MNRLGMLVDISHVNDYAMMDTLDITLAPGKLHTSKLIIHLKLFSIFVSHFQSFVSICAV